MEQNIAGISKHFKNLDLEFRISLEAPVVPAYQLQTKTNLSIPNTKKKHQMVRNCHLVVSVWSFESSRHSISNIDNREKET